MPNKDIKAKEKSDVKIKKLDKSEVYSKKYKSKIVNIKEKPIDNINEEINQNDSSVNEYGTEKISKVSKEFATSTKNAFNSYGQNSFDISKENIKKTKDKIKKKYQEKKLKKDSEEKSEENNNNLPSTNSKKNENSVKKKQGKNSNIKQKQSKDIKSKNIKKKEKKKKTSNLVKKSVNKKQKEKLAEENLKAFKKAYQIAKAKAKKIAKTAKRASKAIINAIKKIILALKTLINFLIAGLWIVVMIIIVISIIAMICSSAFGIFFSNEQTSSITIDGVQQNMTMSELIASLNKEFMDKITKIQKDNPYDEYDISGKRADWKDILAIYTAKVSNGSDGVDLITLDENKVKTLKEIFWKMNDVSFTKDVESHEEVIIHFTWTEYKTVTHTKLHVKISGKSVDDVMSEYLFSDKQKEQVAELRADDYSSMWSTVIYGNSSGNNNIVQVALQQVGNVGGQPYWSWYGFESRVEWCACFVSWCANECGYIKNGIIPKFATCESEGVVWFKTCGLWKSKGYTPNAGDIIFFDWSDSNDGKADHVGIVEKVEDGKVYTIEGNSNEDTCRQKEYSIDSSVILGYGTPMY